MGLPMNREFREITSREEWLGDHWTERLQRYDDAAGQWVVDDGKPRVSAAADIYPPAGQPLQYQYLPTNPIRSYGYR
jgi:hypothetical protein